MPAAKAECSDELVCYYDLISHCLCTTPACTTLDGRCVFLATGGVNAGAFAPAGSGGDSARPVPPAGGDVGVVAPQNNRCTCENGLWSCQLSR